MATHSAKCGWRRLTLHSSGPPTALRASHQAQGLRPILRLLSGAQRRRGPLNSNVRLHKLGVRACQHFNPHKCNRHAFSRAVLHTRAKVNWPSPSVSKGTHAQPVPAPSRLSTQSWKALLPAFNFVKSHLSANFYISPARSRSPVTSLPPPRRKQTHVIDRRVVCWQSHAVQANRACGHENQ
jgi:hypothetical protein